MRVLDKCRLFLLKNYISAYLLECAHNKRKNETINMAKSNSRNIARVNFVQLWG